MRAAFIRRTGPPEVIQYGELPKPIPRENELLVRVEAVSVNPIDTYIRSGRVPMNLPMPFIIGCDFAGTVEAVGEKVIRFRPGDRVWGSNQGLLGRQGTFAEYITVHEQWAYPLPEKVGPETAAAAALVGITAHLGLFREARLRSGEWIAVSGASGAVGSMVVQMAKLAGAFVIALTSSSQKAEFCYKLGADRVIDYTRENVVEKVHEIVPGGVQVWWETSRNPDLDRAVEACSTRGRIIVMAGREARPAFPLGRFYVKCLCMKGFVMFLAPPADQEQAAMDINRWLSEGALRVVIDRVLPLSQAVEAHRLQEERTLENRDVIQGKVVLKP